jgi:hypothetical protein
MMNQNEQTKSATGVPMAVFEPFHKFPDEVVFEISRAIELIEAYGDWRARKPPVRPGTVVQLRLVRGSRKGVRDCF